MQLLFEETIAFYSRKGYDCHVCQAFGNSAKFLVVPVNESVDPTGTDPIENVFGIMSSQRQLCKPRLPERIVEKKTSILMIQFL